MILTHLVLFSFFDGASPKKYIGVHIVKETLTTPTIINESLE